jgi:purine-binding chemotaxis protein CheW
MAATYLDRWQPRLLAEHAGEAVGLRLWAREMVEQAPQAVTVLREDRDRRLVLRSRDELRIRVAYFMTKGATLVTANAFGSPGASASRGFLRPRLEVILNLGGLLLVFRAGTHLCGLDLAHVVETMRPLPVRAVLGAPAFVCGVSVVRGAPVPVLSIASMIGGKEGSLARRFVTVREQERVVALAVDEVLGVREMPQDSFRELSPLVGEVESGPVVALGALHGEPLLVLTAIRVVPDSVWAALEKQPAIG